MLVFGRLLLSRHLKYRVLKRKYFDLPFHFPSVYNFGTSSYIGGNSKMTFLYFAYGSNLLSDRMHINCPCAKKRTTAVLKNYKLKFFGYAHSWKGATATIVEDLANEVWGVVWEISTENERSLDKQESGYKQITVIVKTPSEDELVCKSYMKEIDPCGKNILPSTIYKAIIVQGAIEQQLPKEYIKQLEIFKDNGYDGPVDIPVKIKL